MRKRRLLLGLFGVLVCASAWGFYLEPRRLVVHDEALTLPAWPAPLAGLKVVAISDIHLGGLHMPMSRVREIVARTNALEPDLVVLLGDFVATSHLRETVEPEALGATLGGLRARLGTFAVLGNHDWWFNGPRIRNSLEAAGITVLDDRVVPLTVHGTRFWLGGVPDEYTQLPDPSAILGGVPDDEPVVFITHNPDVFPRVPTRVGLTLAGHTHGGQVRLPIIGARVVPSRYGQRYARGHVVEHGHDLFVTTGVGTSILPVRFGVPPEIALLRLF